MYIFLCSLYSQERVRTRVESFLSNPGLNPPEFHNNREEKKHIEYNTLHSFFCSSLEKVFKAIWLGCIFFSLSYIHSKGLLS